MKKIILSLTVVFILFFSTAPALAVTCDVNTYLWCYDGNTQRCGNKLPPDPMPANFNPDQDCKGFGPSYTALACTVTIGEKPEQCKVSQDQAGSLGCCVQIDSNPKNCVDIKTQTDFDLCRRSELDTAFNFFGIMGGKWTLSNSGCAAINNCPQYLAAAAAQGAAQTSDPLKDLLIKSPGISIKIPGLDFTQINKVDEEGYLYIPWIAEYMTALYKFLIGIVSIVAVVMIIIQGARVVTSGGGEAKMDAYKKIFRAIIGLVIAWGSYAILYNVNPNLVTFNALKVQYIKTEYMPDYNAQPDDNPSGGEPAFTTQLSVADLQQYKGKGCGKNLVEIAMAYAKQQICQGPVHCANFVSRVLLDSGCDKSYTHNGAGGLAQKLQEHGWKLIKSKVGVKAGDIVFWGGSNCPANHTGIATGIGYGTIESNVNMSKCWPNKSDIEKKCGNFWTQGYKPSDEIRKKYAECVADNGACAPYNGVRPESCKYCAKLQPISEYENLGKPSRQCIYAAEDAGFSCYARNPINE
jgi:hypothetical protein